MDNYKKLILDTFFPKFCLGCKKEGSYLCQDCCSLLDITECDYCLCDKNPVILARDANHSLQKGKCNRCSDKKLAGLYFAMPYKDLGKKIIHSFKYKPYLKDMAQILASLLAEHFIKTGKNTNEIWENSILVPVPLHESKLKSRGYNQSEELARELSKVLQIPVVSDWLIKIKKTGPQMELGRQEREKNLRGAFAINPEQIGKESPFARNISKAFLVDDVYTTGFTMAECASVLKKAGVKQVWGIALAREE